MYLLDTNIVSELMRAVCDVQVARRFDQHQANCAVSVVVWDALRFGLLCIPDSKRRTRLESAFSNLVVQLPVLDFVLRAANWHAHERARLSNLGRKLPYVDGQIAATAAVNGLVLITRNVRDFEMYQGLVVENWFD